MVAVVGAVLAEPDGVLVLEGCGPAVWGAADLRGVVAGPGTAVPSPGPRARQGNRP